MNRDSLVLTLTILGAVVGYLMAAGDPPTSWTYQQWLQALAFGVATVAAKLSTSPLKGEHD